MKSLPPLPPQVLLCVATMMTLAPVGVWGLGSRVWSWGFGVWGLGFGVWVLGFGVWGFENSNLGRARAAAPTT